MGTLCIRGLCCLALVGISMPSWADEWKLVEVKKYGYSFKIPAEFTLEGKEDKTTSWTYQPGSASGAGAEQKAAGGIRANVRVGGLSIGGRRGSDDSAGSSSGGLEPALMVYVNWVWMPDVAESTLYQTNLDSDRKNMQSPDPDYTGLVILNKENGYPNFSGGSAYAFKEVNKDDNDEIHRWHIKAFGNKSMYTIGLTGTYGQFKEWGPKFEEVIKSFKLIPLEEQ